MSSYILPYVGMTSLLILAVIAIWQAFIIRALIATGNTYCNTAKDALRQLSIANKDVANLRAALIMERKKWPVRDAVSGEWRKRGS